MSKRLPPSTGSTHEARGFTAAVAALGVVFGDIGTSPLYALRMCLSALPGGSVDAGAILGVLSLVFWSITVVITIKYLVYILRADLNGEGGVLALMVLSLGGRTPTQAGGLWLALGIGGAALLYGDGMITPAISVLSGELLPSDGQVEYLRPSGWVTMAAGSGLTPDEVRCGLVGVCHWLVRDALLLGVGSP